MPWTAARRKEIQEFYDSLDIYTRAKMEILKALFCGMLLTLLTLALGVAFIVAFVLAAGRLGTAIETAIKQRRKKNLSPQPDRRSSGSVADF